jgi:hypothetical protein
MPEAIYDRIDGESDTVMGAIRFTVDIHYECEQATTPSTGDSHFVHGQNTDHWCCQNPKTATVTAPDERPEGDQD